MRIIVDHDLCESNAVCVGEAPEVFGLDEANGMVVLTETARADHLALVVDAELFRLDSLIRWLDTADGRLKRAAAAGDAAPAPRPFPLPKARRRVGAPE